MTTVSSSTFDAAVKRLQTTFDGNKDLFTLGQFYVTDLTQRGFLQSIRQLLQDEIPENDTNAIMTALGKVFDSPISQINLDVVNKALEPWNHYGALSAVRQLFPPGPPSSADQAYATRAFNLLWSSTSVAGPPLFAPTLARAQAAFTLEKDKCFPVARGFANKLLAAWKVASTPKKLVLSAGTIANAYVQEEPNDGSTANSLTKQTLLYRTPAALQQTISGMTAAIDAGATVQCGVLSGVRQDSNLFKEPEHYVLCFAHDTVDGMDAFLFWDPDAAKSRLSSTTWGPGFGCLFGAGGRLSTAVDDADLQAVNTEAGATTEGDHLNDLASNKPLDKSSVERRHRYQVYYVQTLPLKTS